MHGCAFSNWNFNMIYIRASGDDQSPFEQVQNGKIGFDKLCLKLAMVFINTSFVRISYLQMPFYSQFEIVCLMKFQKSSI